MADIVFDYQVMAECVGEIDAISGKYKTLAGNFQEAYKGAVSKWTGAAKNQTDIFVTQAVDEFLAEQIPSLLTGLAQILQANIDNMGKADLSLQEEIPSTLGGEG